MSANIHQFPRQDHAIASDPFVGRSAETDPAVKAKLEELQAWTICYNRELLRLTRELNELRSKDMEAA
jgi:hypothetical protein